MKTSAVAMILVVLMACNNDRKTKDDQGGAVESQRKVPEAPTSGNDVLIRRLDDEIIL